ncbi:MAG: glycogen debranching protein GlgX [Candidatus Riflebacteria bacterium]|nr:glycogen debranching protein GlgX [Candidatus Riflebacteria bacterium]
MDRIDGFPTDTFEGFQLRMGKPLPFGTTLVPGGVNFSIFSSNATSCELALFNKRETKPFVIIPIPEKFRIGNVWSMIVFNLDIEEIEYAYRMDGPFSPEEGHRFNKDVFLMDPYAKAIGGRDVWGAEPNREDPYPHRARILLDDFDWEGDRPLELPMEDLVIYEMHVRGFSKHESAGIEAPGTFAGIREKIPYLKDLGVNCLELMPIFEFDEWENSKISPVTGEQLFNYWGYSQVGFFAPKAGLAATGQFGMQADELKTTIRDLHRNGMEVMLDVVFNHTAEGNENGPYISFRGLDNKTYYILTPEGYYYNFSGCGNTLNCNNPVVRNMILDCLRYWVAEYHIDGFRFDLASILGRDQNGAPMSNPPLLESLAFDPILGKCKLVAEAWDAGGLYQVGSFPAYNRWAEWNGKYRDDVRRFLKGDDGYTGALKCRIEGSPDLYQWEGRGSKASINFITCHDGFTLRDMFSYNGKHNESNGENNNDGGNDNHSWNCGWEGDCDDAGVKFMRKQMSKNALAILLASRGVPMILGGDEIGNTQFGSNNAYCQDNDVSWIDWSLMDEYADLHRFFKHLIAFRRNHCVLRHSGFFQHQDYMGSGYPDISWHGTKLWEPDFSGRSVAFLLDGKHALEGSEPDNSVFCAINMHWEMHGFELPPLGDGLRWHIAVNTGVASPEDIWEAGQEPVMDNQGEVLVGARSIIIAIAK